MRASYVRLFADASGVSHFEDLEIEMVPGFAAPPAEPLYHAPFMATAECSWVGGNSAWKGDVPHPAPYRFLLVNIRGEFQVTAGDGAVRDVVPGSVMLVEDTWGTGHSTRSTSVGEGWCLFFKLADSTG
jgi:hypothetical protein